MPLNVSTSGVTNTGKGQPNFRLPFQPQIDFFLQKVDLPSDHWDDIRGAGHDRGFIVAGAAKADLIMDLREAVRKAIADGTGLDVFREQFDDIVAKHGWSYKGGRDWRTKVIYETNLRASYAAGRYSQLMNPALLKARPYWKYIHNDTVQRPRPLHLAWGQKPVVLRYDDPWWQAHFPPNGFGCRCRITAVREDEYPGDPAPNDGTHEYIDRWGEIHTLPAGVDYGWNYLPGRTWMPQIDKYPRDLAKAVVSGYARDGVLERWRQRLAKQLEQWKGQAEFSKLSGDDLVTALRKSKLIPNESLVVGVIGGTVQSLLESKSQTLLMSADTVIKQLVKREGQPIDIEHYLTLQAILDSAQIVKLEGGNKVVYWFKDGKIWYAVIKVTKDRVENYLVSLRSSNVRDAKRVLTAEELKVLGVA